MVGPKGFVKNTSSRTRERAPAAEVLGVAAKALRQRSQRETKLHRPPGGPVRPGE